MQQWHTISTSCFVLFYRITRRQEGRYSELLQKEGSSLAHLMESFAEDGSDAKNEVCVRRASVYI